MARSLPAEPSATFEVDHFTERYQLHELLGQGGMATVHRATDRMLAREVALKQLTVTALTLEHAHVAALFEREFHILAQLRHPHVISVFDYGLQSNGTAFYTMDLLDGGDLRELAPLPWREACRVMFDICSALALLHSRHLLHRDVTPRNIRCTRASVAKLIDFGAMCPMTAGGSEIVGTPAFTAPETLQRLALDARTDLYSFGVTLYYALTAHLPYSARTFADLASAWADKPVAPSAFVPDIPSALDDLVLSLLSVDAGLRPANAFEVMERLAACASLSLEESAAISQAYLSTPMLVGREDALSRLRAALRDSRSRRSAGIIVQAPSGRGRSRLMDACALDALTFGFSVARTTATGAREPFAVAKRLVGHLLDTLPRAAELAAIPELLATPDAANDPQARPSLRNLDELQTAEAQQLLRRFIQGLSRAYPLLIAVDDVHKIDLPSAALLAELLDSTKRRGILVLLTADSDAGENDALHALARRCKPCPLASLTPPETHQLLGSLFGQVANLDLLSHEIHDIALGNPRQTLELAQHLIDRRVIRYVNGHWTLPSKLSAEDLPRSTAAAMQVRIQRFSPEARFLAQAQALAFDEDFTDADYRALLPSASSRDVELAVFELLEAAALMRDGTVYRLANRVWSAAFVAELDPEQTRLTQRALTRIYDGQNETAFIHHAFAAGLDEQGLVLLEQRKDAPADPVHLRDMGRLAWCFPRAIETARRLGHSRRAEHDLRRWQYFGSIASPLPADRASARIWLEQISHDAGIDLYRADKRHVTAQERLLSSLQRAQDRYLTTPEPERVYPVDQAIRKLAEYVLYAVVDGARSLDSELLQSLPDLVEPYASLTPQIEAIWLNVLGAREAHCNANYVRACALWRDTLDKIERFDPLQHELYLRMRNAIVFALGTGETQLGLPSAALQAERLETDDFQRISALALRKVVQLERGDVDAAERFRRQAEVLSLQQRIPQMFIGFRAFEAFVHMRCNNLAGLTDTIEQVKVLASRYPGWRPALLNAEGSFQLVRGDYEAARSKFEAGIAQGRAADGTRVYFPTWINLHAGLGECLLALGCAQQARDVADAALLDCESRGSADMALELIHVIALADATLGDPQGAERLDALIERQNALGVSGLRMGLTYEARARVAIWSGDAEAFDRFAILTAREYRHGARTPLAARYERLMNEAARAGMQSKLSLADLQALAGQTHSTVHSELLTSAARRMAGRPTVAQRASSALEMLCTTHGAGAGHLFLVSPSGAVLAASHGGATASGELAERVAAYVSHHQELAAELDDMATGAQADVATHAQPSRPDDCSHQLLALRCIAEGESVLVGVAALERSEGQDIQPLAELLSFLALSLLESERSRHA